MPWPAGGAPARGLGWLLAALALAGIAWTRAEASREADWEQVAVLMRAAEAAAGTADGAPEYLAWRRQTQALAAETGWAFYQAWGDDARRWQWAEFLVVHTDQLPQTGTGEAGWRERLRRIREEGRLAPDTPAALRLRFLCEELDERRFLSYYLGEVAAAKVDWVAAARELAAIAARFPQESSAALRNLAAFTIRQAKRHAPGADEEIRALFSANASETLQDLARGLDAVAAARAAPVELRFTAIDGQEVDLAKLRGKVVLLDFRGVTWCGACREEEPFMKEAYARYRDHGFEILTITYEMREASRAFVQAYARERGLAWPFYFDGRGAENPHLKRFGITSVPQHFLLDRDGRLASTEVRGARLDPAVRRLLGLPAAPAEAATP
ncbi:MAG: TlpA family protein disulfide reductase [Opitutaceae bacterium]|nr:TlpA family protein disulfide reductase [Opitutaceae bacterium]